MRFKRLAKIALIALPAVAVLAASLLPAQTVNADPSVTVTVYVYNYGANPAIDPAIAGAQVQGRDGNGTYFSQTTNVMGYVTLTGAPGVWVITVSDWGYQDNGPWMVQVGAASTFKRFLVPASQGNPGNF